MIVKKSRITAIGILRLLADEVGNVVHVDKLDAWRKWHYPKYHSLDEYFPSVVGKIVTQLVRKGLVEKQETAEGLKVKITENGLKKVLLYKIDDFKPKSGMWDGRWRIIFFDVEELSKRRRNQFRRYIRKLGLKSFQKSVYITPFDVRDEISYLREILDIPNAVKWGILEQVENEAELKTWFGL